MALLFGAFIILAIGLFAAPKIFPSDRVAGALERATLGLIVAAPAWILLLIGFAATR